MVSLSGRVPYRFGTGTERWRRSRTEIVHEPNVSNDQCSKHNRTERKTNRSALFRGQISKALCDVFLRLSKVLEFQSSSPPVECPYSISLARPGFRHIHKLMSFPFLVLFLSISLLSSPICVLDCLEKAYSQIAFLPFPFPFPFFLCFPFLVLSFPFPCPVAFLFSAFLSNVDPSQHVCFEWCLTKVSELQLDGREAARTRRWVSHQALHGRAV